MQPTDPRSELSVLRTLVEAVERRLAALTGGAPGLPPTPRTRSIVQRAKGHLELAERALSELDVAAAPAPASPGAGDVRATRVVPRLVTSGEPLPRIVLDRPRAGGAPAPAAPAGDGPWLQGRLDEIGRALESALGGGDSESGEGPRGSDPGVACEAAPQFYGDSESLSVPDLIGFFQGQSKTGVLEISDIRETFRLELHEGALVHAESSASPLGERLGDILVRRGAVTEARLARFLENLSPAERLGDVLLRCDGVGEKELAAAIEDQVLGIFIRMARLPGCRFTFRECEIDGEVGRRVRYNVTRLLLDSAREVDESLERRPRSTG